MKDLIKEINKTKWKGYFLETGCGMPVSNSFFNYDGASKTVISCISLYSKEGDPHIENCKAVSKKYIYNTLTKYADLDNNEFIYSFSGKYDKTGNLSHGWVGIKKQEDNKETIEIFHITLPSYSVSGRSAIIDMFGRIGIKLLHSILTKQYDLIPWDYIDVCPKKYFHDIVNNSYNILCFDLKEKQLVRIADVVRTFPETNIYPGSFNPWHKGHDYIYNSSENVIPLITLNNVDKSAIDSTELFYRIRGMIDFNDSIRYVACFSSPYLSTLCNELYKMDKKHRTCFINILQGSDTTKRVLLDPACLPLISNYSENQRLNIKCFQRKGYELSEEETSDRSIELFDNPYGNVSSTEIRKDKNKKELTTLKTVIDAIF